MWTLLTLILDTSIVVCRDVSQMSKNILANTVDPDEMARHEDLHCLNRYIFRSTGLQELICSNILTAG